MIYNMVNLHMLFAFFYLFLNVSFLNLWHLLYIFKGPKLGMICIFKYMMNLSF